MKQYRVVVYLFLATALTPLSAWSGDNVLSNASFEAVGSFSERAYHFEWGQPDNNGAYWGTAIRINWRSHSGSWEGAIRGSWAGDTVGGMWQQKPATAGKTYQASAWFWADNSVGNVWSADANELKIEFFDAGFVNLGTTVLSFDDVVEVWTQKTVTAVAPEDTAWARWVVAAAGVGAQGALQYDDVELIEVDEEIREQDFNEWTTETTDGCHTRGGWQICTGRTTTVNARSGYAADLGDPSNSNAGHYIQSSQLTNGIGSVSFWYRHIDGTGDALDYVLQTSSDGSSWTTVAQLTGISSTDYQQFNLFLNEPAEQYIRILHTNGENRLLVDDISVEFPSSLVRFQDFDSWDVGTSDGVTNKDSWIISTGRVTSTKALVGNAAKLVGSTGGDSIQSPAMPGGIGEISFYYRHEDGTNALAYSIQLSTDAVTWVTFDTISGITNVDYEQYTLYLYEPSNQYMRIHHDSGGKCLYVDSIDVGIPALFRKQNFDTWPTVDTYTFSEHQGWTVSDGRINDDRPFSGQSARMDRTPASGQYIQSPYFPEGVGSITFQYARDATGSLSGAVRYDLEISGDGTNWLKIADVDMTTEETNYQQFAQYLSETTNHFVRLYHDGGGERALFDSICVVEPTDPADISMSATHLPVNPWTNDEVNILATIALENGAFSPAITTYYRVGTSGAFSAIDMQTSNQVNFVTTSTIPPQPTNTTVQYYLCATFTGLGSHLTSPALWPDGGSNNPASYGLPRNRPGLVWINELNYISDLFSSDDDTNEYVEISGPENTDIGGWSIQLYKSDTDSSVPVFYSHYTIPTNTILSNDYSRFGFFVLGDAQLLTVADMNFTNLASGLSEDHMWNGSPPGGVRLLNELGAEESSISYRGPISSFETIPTDKDALDPTQFGLSLTGTGGAASAFAWSMTNATPGTVNVGQFIIQCPADLFLQCTNDVPAPDTNSVISGTDCGGGHIDIIHLGDVDNAGSACAGDPLIITRTYRVTDNCGNTNDCSQTITVADTVIPEITGPSDTNIDCGASIHPDDIGWATATDNCDTNPAVSYVDNYGPDCPVIITRTWQATDTCGNTSTVDQVITLTDTTAPMLANVPTNKTMNDTTCLLAPPTVVASDNCDTNISIVFYATTNGTCTRTISNVWSATDACGNSVGATQVVTLIDTTTPMLVGIPNNSTNQCDDTVPVTSKVIAVDNANPLLALYYKLNVDREGTAADVSTNRNDGTINGATYTTDGAISGAYDFDGANDYIAVSGVPAATGSLTVAAWIKTTQNVGAQRWIMARSPWQTGAWQLMTQSGKAAVEFGPGGQLQGTVNVADDQWHHIVGIYDASDNVRYLYVDGVLDGQDGAKGAFTENANEIRIGVRPGASSYFDGTIDEPVILAYAMSSYEVTNLYTCGGLSSEIPVLFTSTTNGTDCSLVITNTWTATDDCGNSIAATQTILIVDSTAPTITNMPTNETIECGSTIPVIPGDVGAVDNCDTNTLAIVFNAATNDSCPTIITRTWSATDACGNMVAETQTITIVDTTAPLITNMPANVSVECDAIPDVATGVGAFDSCDTNILSVNFVATTNGYCPTVIERIWWTTDLCGNSVAETQTITVVDTTPPVITNMPTNLTVECNAIPAVPTNVGATDACYGDSCVAISSSDLRLGFGFDIDEGFQVSDASTNTNDGVVSGAVYTASGYRGGACIFDGVNDGIFISGDDSLGVLNNTIAAWVKATDYSDNDQVIFSTLGDTYTAGGIQFDIHNDALRINYRTISNESPIVITPTVFSVADDDTWQFVATTYEYDGTYSTVKIYLNGTPILTNVTASGALTYSNQTAFVGLNKDSASLGACCEREFGGTIDEFCLLGYAMSESEIQDLYNCKALGSSLDFSATTNGTCPTLISRIWTATDVCGNSVAATQTITVVDTTPPSITNVPANTTVECDAVPAVATNVGVVDACDMSVTLYFSATTNGTCPTTVARIWSATDTCDNAISVTQIITVADTTDAIITNCPTNVMVETTNDVPAVNTNLVGGTDNCTPVVLIAHVSDVDDGGSGANGDPKTITRTYSVLDACGNGSNCVQVIVVEAGSMPDPGEVEFYDITLGSNISFKSTESSNGWRAVPYYITNLMVDPQIWIPITNYNVVTNGGTNMIWFDYPTGIDPIFIRIEQTNGP